MDLVELAHSCGFEPHEYFFKQHKKLSSVKDVETMLRVLCSTEISLFAVPILSQVKRTDTLYIPGPILLQYTYCEDIGFCDESCLQFYFTDGSQTFPGCVREELTLPELVTAEPGVKVLFHFVVLICGVIQMIPDQYEVIH